MCIRDRSRTRREVVEPGRGRKRWGENTPTRSLAGREGAHYHALPPLLTSSHAWPRPSGGSFMAVDVLAFGPHPDDAETGCGAVLRKPKSRGHSTGIIDMTTGDMGWGTPEIRAEESRQAGEFLKLDVR